MKSLRVPWMISMLLLVMLGIWCGDGNGDCNVPWRWWLWSVMVIMNAVTPMVLVMLAAAKWTGFTLAYLGLKPGLEAHQPGLPTHCPPCTAAPVLPHTAVQFAGLYVALFWSQLLHQLTCQYEISQHEGASQQNPWRTNVAFGGE